MFGVKMKGFFYLMQEQDNCLFGLGGCLFYHANEYTNQLIKYLSLLESICAEK